jgi:hypothetical protein
MVDERAEALESRSFRCFGAAVVTAIVAMTILGLCAPWSVLWAVPVPPDSLGFIDSDVDLGSLAAVVALFLGGMIGGWFGWAILMQHRRPWPLGPRLSSERMTSRWPLRVAPFLVAYLFARMLMAPIRDATGLGFTPIDGYWIGLSTSVGYAIEGVLWISIYALVAIPAYLLTEAMLRAWYPNEAPVRVAASDTSAAAAWAPDDGTG